MPIRPFVLASAVMFAALCFVIDSPAELKSVGTPEIAMHLPGGTAGLAVDGKSSELIVQEFGGVIMVTAKLDCVTEQRGHTSCIKTGIAMRERHLWKYLDAGKFHEATLSVDHSQVKVPKDHEKVEGDATGTFSLHGVQRALSIHYAAQRTGSDIQVRGRIDVNLKDFNIEQPSFAGVRTGMIAEIKVQFALHDS